MTEILDNVKSIPTTDDGNIRQLRNIMSNVHRREEVEAVCEVMVALFPDIYMDVLKNRYMFTLNTFNKVSDTIQEHNDYLSVIMGVK